MSISTATKIKLRSLIVVAFRAYGCTTAGLRLAPIGRLKMRCPKGLGFESLHRTNRDLQSADSTNPTSVPANGAALCV